MSGLLKQMEEFSFHKWFDNFEKDSVRGVVIPIPFCVLEYLREEIVVLPKECYQLDNRESSTEFETEPNHDTDDNGSDEEEAYLAEPEFPEFSEKLSKTIQELPDCSAFLKTKWHCPKDSFWITAGQTLKVKDIVDVYQLLKASSIVKQDIFENGLPENLLSKEKNHVETSHKDQYIVFKEWHDIHPGTEFRCFVRKRNLIAISPRDWPSYHQFIVEQKGEICSDIVSLFKEKIKMKFPLEHFTFDVVRVRKDHVLILDFSPFNEDLTESLAFDWVELQDELKFLEILAINPQIIFFDHKDDNPEFRYLPEDCGIQPSRRNNYGIPVDIIQMFNENSATKQSTDLNLLLSGIQSENQSGKR